MVAPVRAVTVLELLPVLHEFDNALVSLAEADVARQGKQVSCCAGCGACCRQVVPIAEPEARHLAQLVAELPEPRRTEIRRRFATVCEKLDEIGLTERLLAAPALNDDDARGALGIEYFRLGLACPFLEDESCSIHPQRPLACREFLVTSPAVHCQQPSAETIERVPLPTALSEKLYRFGEGAGRTAARWMPLVFALRWAEEHTADELPTAPGHELFQQLIQPKTKPPA